MAKILNDNIYLVIFILMENAISKGSCIGLSIVRQTLEEYKYEYKLEITNISHK